jgi:hypothetical protein
MLWLTMHVRGGDSGQCGDSVGSSVHYYGVDITLSLPNVRVYTQIDGRGNECTLVATLSLNDFTQHRGVYTQSYTLSRSLYGLNCILDTLSLHL